MMVTCHGFYDDGEVSLAVSQGYVAASCSQVSYSLQVAPSWLDELSGVSCSNNNHIISVMEEPSQFTQDKGHKQFHYFRIKSITNRL